MGQQTNHKQHTQTNHIIIFKLHNIQFSVRYDNDCNSLLSGGYSVLFSQWNHTLTHNRLAACALFSHHRRYIRQSTARLPLALASLKLRKLRTWVVTETSINEIKWRLLPCRLQVNQSCHARQTLVPGKISANTFTLTNYEMKLSHEYSPMGFAFQAKTRREFSSQFTKSRLDAGFGWSLMKINFVLRGWFHVAFADQKLQHQSNQLTNSTADTFFLQLTTSDTTVIFQPRLSNLWSRILPSNPNSVTRRASKRVVFGAFTSSMISVLNSSQLSSVHPTRGAVSVVWYNFTSTTSCHHLNFNSLDQSYY